MPYVTSAREVKALTTQLDRVNGQNRAAVANGDPDALRRQLADANARIITLERQLAEAKLLLAAYEDGGAVVAVSATTAALTWHGAQRITAKEAAQLTNVSLSTVSRYCEQGFWRAEQDASGRWLIDAAQELRRKQRRSATNRKSRK